MMALNQAPNLRAGERGGGHDEHFLGRLDRVVREHVEVALGLYQDHELVRQLLREQGVTPDGDRIAIALADSGRGPHVIVAADGAFVTCLGEGMSTGPWRVIRRATLDGLLRRVAEQRRRRAIAARFSRPGEDSGALVGRLFRRKNMLSREELVAASSVASLLGKHLFKLCAETATNLHETRMRMPLVAKGPHATELADAHARRTWNAAYAIELCGIAGRDVLGPMIEKLDGVTTFSMLTALLVDHTFFLRGLWAAGKIGKPLISSYRTRLDVANSYFQMLDAVLGLTTIALRHSGTRADVERILRRTVEQPIESDLDSLRVDTAARGLFVLEKEEDVLELSLIDGAVRYADDSRGRLEPGDADRFEDERDVPLSHAKTAYLTMHGSFADGEADQNHLLFACPLLARASAEDFHYPSALTHKLLTPWGIPEVARHEAQLRKVTAAPAPVKRAALPSRNERCLCGSGKKFKRCCSK